MAYTFLKAQGKEIGNSKLEEEKLDIAREILSKAKDKIILPSDHIIVEKIEHRPSTKTVLDNIPAGWIGVDIGPQTIDKFIALLSDARTILWNGPLGIFEIDALSEGTHKVAQFVARSSALGVVTGAPTTTSNPTAISVVAVALAGWSHRSSRQIRVGAAIVTVRTGGS